MKMRGGGDEQLKLGGVVALSIEMICRRPLATLAVVRFGSRICIYYLNRRQRGTSIDSTKVNRRQRGTSIDSTKVNCESEK